MRDPAWKEKLPVGYDTWVHLVGINKSIQDPTADLFERINFGKTKEAYDCFLESKGQKFIFLSSIKSSVEASTDDVLKESSPQHPISAYGKSKLKAEQYLLDHQHPAQQTLILQPTLIHGPENYGNLRFLFQLVRKGLPFPFAGARNKRSFLSIGNLNFVIAKLITQPVASGRYLVADSDPLSTVEVISIAEEILGKRISKWALNEKSINLVARMFSKVGITALGQVVDKLCGSMVVSNAKILDAIQSELPISSKQGLAATFQSMREEISKNKKK